MENKIVVITGGATGMGFAVAKTLVSRNTVVSVDRNPVKIAALKHSLPAVHSVVADLTVPEDQLRAIEWIGSKFGRVDVLFNNAGVGGESNFIGLDEYALNEKIEAQMAINFTAPVMFTKRAFGLLEKSSEPSVIFSTMGLVYTPMAILGTYCASKSAMHAFVMSLRHQLTASEIRVVEVLPPSVDTALNTDKDHRKISADQFARQFLKQLEKGKTVINVGQSAFLAKLSRWAPRLTFRMLNPVPRI
jgi:uncharacterized oxidoreductase